MFHKTLAPLETITMKSVWENNVSSRTKIPETELVLALQRRDKKALEYLYDHYSETLYGVIFQVLQNDNLAEDVLQESFVKIWKNIASYQKEKGRLFTWLLRIARNSAIDKLRSKHQKVSRLSLDSPLSSHVQTQSETIPIDRIGIKDLLVNMKPEHKQLIDLIYFKGFSQSETAKHLDIPLGTVKSRTRLALNFLRKVLKQEQI